MIFKRVFIFFFFRTIVACDYKTLNNLSFAENSFIELFHFSLPKLCEKMFTAIPKIDSLYINDCQVEEIEAHFLQNLHSNVSLIRILNNKIFKIQSETFANLATSSITLPNNSIRIVENQAFKNLTNLLHLSLISNQLASFDSDWFVKVPQLTTLNLIQNNISSLPENSFKFLKTANAKLYFDKNKVRFLHKNTMACTSAKNLSLYLTHNLINKIPNSFFKNLTFDEVDLVKNPIEEFPEDFFISEFIIQRLSVPLHQFKEKNRKQLLKWSVKKNTKLTKNFLEEENCSSKISFNFQVLLFLLYFCQAF